MKKKASPVERITPSAHRDCIYDDGNTRIYRQGYGFADNEELSREEVAEILQREQLVGSLTWVGRRELRGLI